VQLKPLTILALGSAPLLAAAQGATRIVFDSPRPFVTFFSDKLPTSDPPNLEQHSGATADIQLPATGTLYIWDRKTGNIASKPLTKVGKVWHVTDKDLSKVGFVTVVVEYKGEPASTARIELKDKARTQSQLIDSSSDGAANFYVVEPGNVLVTVDYRSNGHPAPQLKQQFTIEHRRAETDPVLRVALPYPTETLSSRLPTSGQARAEQPQKKSNFLGSLAIYLLALATAGTAAYFLYVKAKGNQDWVKAKMEKLGVDPIVQQQPAPEPDLSAAAPPVPQPPSKIILDNADLQSSPALGAPRLVRPTGEFATLQSGETVVGREDGLGISLQGESSVSRRHAALTLSGSSLTVKDLGSTNGTFVNGRRIDAETPLSPGDEVQFGVVRFRLEK
jgi:hypothetical protein